MFKIAFLSNLRVPKRFLLRSAVLVLILASLIVTMVLALEVLNADMFERLSESKNFGRSFGSEDIKLKAPVLRLVIHRLLPDENAAEASMVLTADYSLLDDLKKKKEPKLVGVVYDGSGYQPFSLLNTVILEPRFSRLGFSQVSVESERFKLSALPSVSGFPFDDVDIEAIAEVVDTDGFQFPHEFEVQKALPGRILKASLVSGRGSILLTRSWTEKSLILTSSAIFVLVCLLVAARLFSARTSLRGIEEILAIAGFVIAAGGFRSLLNFPATAGTTALEVAVLGVPLVALALGFAISTLRGSRDGAQQSDQSG